MKKLLSIILTLALIVTLVPWYSPTAEVSANTSSYFNFTNESQTKASARVVSSNIVTLTGTVNGVTSGSISYNVYQVPATGTSDESLNKRENNTLGISVDGSRITVANLELFPGMNKIQFKGSSGTATVEGVIYIEFRNSPMLTDLELVYNGGSATTGGTRYYPQEDGLVMVYRPSNATRDDLITITGKAPNATNVTLNINGDNYPYLVTQNGGYRFNFSDLELNPGLNTLKFKITSGRQEFETTRYVVLYNQTPVYYAEELEFKNNATTTQTKGYQYDTDYIVEQDDTDLFYKAKLIVPNPFPAVAGDPALVTHADVKAHLDANLELKATVNYTVPGAGGAAPTPTTTSNDYAVDVTIPANADDSQDYFEFEISAPLVDFNADNRDAIVSFRLSLDWGQGTALTSNKQFRLIDGSSMYIADVNYMSGYNSAMVDTVDDTIKTTNPNQFYSMESTDITSAQPAQVFNVPFMVEVLLGQYNNSLSAADLLTALQIKTGSSDLIKKVLVDNNGDVVSQDIVQTINGNPVTYTRVFVEISSLRVAGSNQVSFSLSGNSYNPAIKTYTFNLMTGPYVRFNSIVDSMNIKYNARKNNLSDIVNALGAFEGSIYNIKDINEIVYKYSLDTNGNAQPSTETQTVFLYLNNVELPLRPASNGAKNKFIINGDATTLAELGALNLGGANTIKFVFYSKSYNFSSSYSFVVEPTDLPKIPAERNQDGIYPYADIFQWPPVYNSSDFSSNGNGVSYTTKKGTANVIGSFEIIDLSSANTGNLFSDVKSRLESMTDTSNGASEINPENFKITISSPEWKDETFEWNLTNKFYVSDGDMNILNSSGVIATNPFDDVNTVNASNAWAVKPAPWGDVRIIYNAEDNYFYFNITNQDMPKDNSPLVFVITVYNAGDGGPRATYRLEINPISIPYTIHSPIPENRITNSDFVEVVISSPGAESMTINKIAAEKVKLIDYSKPGNNNFIDAFRVVVKDLKANKDTKIPFTITRSGTTSNDTITVKYVPTTIPGAQSLQTMKSTHNVFEGALKLTFPKNTNLIRTNYAAVNDYATQVYNSHNILFSVANATDGVVNRHLFESATANYDPSNDGLAVLTDKFLDYAGRYIKASNVFWIDAGFADDPSTNAYDPISTGLDPFPYPRFQGLEGLKVTRRYEDTLKNREIIPSKAGELTLKYDPSIVASASTTVTVFHYDSTTQSWNNIGGVVDSKKGTITVPFNQFGYYVVAKLTRTFNDVIGHSYAREAMEAIYAKGIMNAENEAVRFGGDLYVTRGEFTRMIVRALDIPLNYSGTLHFNYYPETMTNGPLDAYDYRYIETAARAGIVNGKSPGFFDEEGQLTREEAAVILARALQLKQETNSEKAKQQLAKAFQDSGSFDFYSIPGVLAIQKKNFIVGIPVDPSNPKAGYVFQPKSRLLRSDAAIIIARVMADQKKLPAIYN